MSESILNAPLEKHIRREVLTSSIINCAINGGLAWWLLQAKGPLHLWGLTGYGLDLIITGFLLSGIMTAIMVAVHRRKLRKGEISHIVLPSGHWLSFLPDGPWMVALVLSVIGALVPSALLVAGLYAAGQLVLAPADYAVIKGIWAGLWAGAVVAVVIPLALRQPLQTGDTSRR